MDQYNTLTPEIISKLKAVSDHILTGDDINPDFSRDEMPIYGTHMPDLVVQPRSTEEVAAIMKICYENTIPVTPRGAGTGLAGGAVPLLGGVLLESQSLHSFRIRVLGCRSGCQCRGGAMGVLFRVIQK